MKENTYRIPQVETIVIEPKNALLAVSDPTGEGRVPGEGGED